MVMFLTVVGALTVTGWIMRVVDRLDGPEEGKTW